MNIAKLFLRNTAVGWLEMTTLIVSALFITPLLIIRLGKEGYGVWVLTGQVIAYLAILDLGVGSSIGRFVAKYHAKNDVFALSRIVNAALFLFLTVSILVIIITSVLCPNFPRFFRLSHEYVNVGKMIVLITGLSVAFSFPLRIGQGVLEGLHRFDLIYLFRFIGAATKLVLVIIFFGLLGCKSLIVIACITVITSIVPNLFMLRTAYARFLKNLTIDFKLIKIADLKEIFSLSLSALLITTSALFLNQTQIILVGRLIDPKAVAAYSIPIMFLTYASMLVSYMAASFKPMASRMRALGDMQGLRKLNIEGGNAAFVVALFFLILSIIFSESFFKRWLSSNDFAPQDLMQLGYILIIMMSGFTFAAPQIITDKMFSGMGKHWAVVAISLIASMVGLVIGIFLMLKTGLGVYGMAIGWATVFLIRGIVYPIAACNFFKIKLFSYLRQAYLPPLKAAVISLGVIFLIKQTVGRGSFIMFLLSLFLSLVVYAMAVYFLCLSSLQKIRIKKLVGKMGLTAY